MKLRNKKTGEVVNAIVYSPIGNYNIRIWKDKDYLDTTCNDDYLGDYKTLAELNEEWEDYNSAEPLIKDEKIRKAVRTWADVVGTDVCTYDRFWETLRSMDTSISFAGVYKFELEDEENYTIAELCGEEEQ